MTQAVPSLTQPPQTTTTTTILRRCWQRQCRSQRHALLLPQLRRPTLPSRVLQRPLRQTRTQTLSWTPCSPRTCKL